MCRIRRMKAALKRKNVRAWHEVEEEFNDVQYRSVRDHRMRELEMEDDMMGKLSVRYVLRYRISGFALMHDVQERTSTRSCTGSRLNL